MIQRTNGSAIYLRKRTNVRQKHYSQSNILPFFYNSFESDGQVFRARTRSFQHLPKEEKWILKLQNRPFPHITCAKLTAKTPSNLVSSYNQADQGKLIDVTFLDLGKAFSTASPRILLDKLSSPQMDKHIL